MSPDAAVASLTDFQRSLDMERVYALRPQRAAASPRCSERLRIVSWNIGRGYDPERIARTLNHLRPDVACLQEVDWGNERTASRDILRHLVEQTGMFGLLSIEFLELHSRLRRRRLAGGGAIGNAILTRLDPGAAFRIELPPAVDWRLGADDPHVPSRVRRRIRSERRIGRRFGLAAELDLGPHKLLVCSVHLEDKLGGVEGRWRQYETVLRAISERRGPADLAVVAGDLNTFDCRLARLFSSDTDAAALGKPSHVSEAHWWKTALLPRTGFSDPFVANAWTFRVPPFFRAKLDWITVSGMSVRNCGVAGANSSDHRPIWIDAEAKAPAGADTAIMDACRVAGGAG